jgi:hypothetical protein
VPFKGEGWQMRSCSSSVLVQQTAEQVTPVYLAWITPLVWLLEVGGMVVDARWLPEAVQVQAWQTGLIPYVPAHAGGDDPAESLAARL